MFNECNSIKYLNLSNFNTYNTEIMGGAFAKCYNLTVLDIRNFDSSSLIPNINLFPDINSNGTIYYNSVKFDKNFLNNNNVKNWVQIDVSEL